MAGPACPHRKLSFEAPDCSVMEGDMQVNLVKEVVIDVLAAMRIIKHCTENLPSMVAGSLLGLDVNGTLEITYSYAFPQPDESTDEHDGAEYQLEMMKMLREVNLDNNCIGWYQSMYMGTVFTNDVVNYQYSYQISEDLSENALVIMYDPIRSSTSSLPVLRAYRLTQAFLANKRNKTNRFISSTDILEELPLSIRALGHVSAAMVSLEQTSRKEPSSLSQGLQGRSLSQASSQRLSAQEQLSRNRDYVNLSMSGLEGSAEKHMELMSAWMDDLLGEQGRFQSYARNNSKLRQEQIRWMNKRCQENAEALRNGEDPEDVRLEDSGLKTMPELPARGDHLLMVAQVDRYVEQVNELVHDGVQKIAALTVLNPQQ